MKRTFLLTFSIVIIFNIVSSMGSENKLGVSPEREQNSDVNDSVNQSEDPKEQRSGEDKMSKKDQNSSEMNQAQNLEADKSQLLDNKIG